MPLLNVISSFQCIEILPVDLDPARPNFSWNWGSQFSIHIFVIQRSFLRDFEAPFTTLESQDEERSPNLILFRNAKWRYLMPESFERGQSGLKLCKKVLSGPPHFLHVRRVRKKLISGYLQPNVRRLGSRRFREHQVYFSLFHFSFPTKRNIQDVCTVYYLFQYIQMGKKLENNFDGSFHLIFRHRPQRVCHPIEHFAIL